MRSRTLLMAGLVLILASVATIAQTSAFTYQGQIKDGGSPANGQYDFRFRLFDLDIGGVPVAPEQVVENVQVTDGIFKVELSFNFEPFTQIAANWIEVSVRPGLSKGEFVTLDPRQHITSAPYAMQTAFSVFSTFSTTATNAQAVGGVPASQIIKEGDLRLTDARQPLPGNPSYVQIGPPKAQPGGFNVNGNGAIGSSLTVFGNTFLNSGLSVGGTITGNGSGITDLNAGNIGSGTLAVGRGGTGLGFSGSPGSYLRSNGTNWASSPLLAGDMPDLGGSYIRNTTTSQDANFSVTGFGIVGGNLAVGSGPVARFTVSTPTASSGNNTAYFAAPNIGPNTSHIHFGTNGDWLIRSASSAGNVMLQDTGGKVGVGGIFGTPERFHVVGDAVFSGSVNAGTQFRISGIRVLSFAPGTTTSTFVGNSSGVNTTGTLNSFFGNGSGQNTTTGAANSFFGALAGQNSNGSSNSFFGVNAGSSTTGSNNAFFGGGAGVSNTTGDNNTLIGTSANVGSGGLTFATAIGSGAVVSTSNRIVLGRSNAADTVQIPGPLNVALFAPSTSLAVCINNSQILTSCSSSSLRYKTNIARFTPGMDLIKKLRPITFDWKQGGETDVGFGAEDVAKADPLFVLYNAKGEVEGVKYDRLSAAFVNAFKELELRLEKQQALIEAQQRELARLKEMIGSKGLAKPRKVKGKR